jgi:hypothetical protein
MLIGKELGNKLNKAMHTEAACNLLPEEYNTYSEGGCRILARALSKMIDGDIWTALYRNQAEHYLVEKDGWLFDAMGARKINDFRSEFYKETKRLVALASYEVESKDIPVDWAVEEKLAEYLRKNL